MGTLYGYKSAQVATRPLTQSGEVTHVVFVGRQNDTGKEFRQAKKDGKRIVCPAWVYMCRDEGRRVDEEIFPHTYNPKMTLNITLSQSTATTRTRSGGGGKKKKSTAAADRKAGKAAEVDETLKEEEEEEVEVREFRHKFSCIPRFDECINTCSSDLMI